MSYYIIFLLISFVSNAQNNATLKADSVEVVGNDEGGGEIVANGNVKINTVEYNMHVDSVKFNVSTGAIVGKNNVKMVSDKSKNPIIVYADKVQGNIKSKNFVFDNVFLNAQNVWMHSEKSAMNDGVATLQNVQLTTCKMIEQDTKSKCKIPWYLNIKNVNFDSTTNKVKAKHLVFKLHNVPLMYFPYIAFNVDRGSEGITSASLVNINSQKGFTFDYVRKIGKFGKVTITPEYYFNIPDDDVSNVRSHNVALLYNFNNQDKSFDVKVKIAPNAVYQSQRNSDDAKNRFYIESNGSIVSNSSVIDVKLDVASDNKFKQIYDLSFQNYLQSHISYTKNVKNNILTANSTLYYPITQDNYTSIPSLVSSVENNFYFNTRPLSYNINFNTNVMQFNRHRGDSGTRVYNVLNAKNIYRYKGYDIVVNPNIAVTNYFYYSNGSDNKSNSAIRVLSDLNINIAKNYFYKIRSFAVKVQPTIFLDTNHVYENGNITNEDSVTTYIKDTNVFLQSIFNGIDVVSNNTKVAYGLRINARNRAKHKYKLLFAQRYNSNSGVSHYVGNTSININKVVFNSRFIFSKHLDKILFSNSNINLKLYKNIDFSVRYFLLLKQLQGDVANTLNDVENITYSVKIRKGERNVFAHITNNPKYVGKLQKEENKIVESVFGVGFESDCLTYSVGYKKRLFFNGISDVNLNAVVLNFKVEL